MVPFLAAARRLNMKQRYGRLVVPIVILLLLSLVVVMERFGILLNPDQSGAFDLPQLTYSQAIQEDPAYLVLTSDQDSVSQTFQAMTTLVLDNLKIAYTVKEITDPDSLTALTDYQVVVLTFQNWDLLGKAILQLTDWVKQGGSLVNASTPEPSSVFQMIAGKLGIQDGGATYTSISGMSFLDTSILGADPAKVYDLLDSSRQPLQISLSVQLRDSAEVHIASEDGAVPLLWSQDYGQGRFVIMNETITDKYQRGILAYAFSLTQDVFVYPVIDGSAFYLDDFPAPVPGGDSEYIERDYGVDTATFYSSIWWPQIMKWEEDYGIVHTGLIIETYNDQVSPPFEANSAYNQLVSFGNELLKNGGELGFHGYNHQPLCLTGTDQALQLGDYKLWPSTDSMAQSLQELNRFARELFPSATFNVYVPPSNIISQTGLATLSQTLPEVKVVASSFLSDSEGKSYEQEFGLSDQGFIETPRIVSGTLLDDYQKLTALSELNFQYVQSHFMHPDDCLDPDRVAASGWAVMSQSFTEYLDWLQQAAPQIRDLTGSQMGTAVEQYTELTVSRKLTGNQLTLQLGGFTGEARLLLRLQDRQLVSLTGGSYEEITDGVYLLTLTSAQASLTLA